MPPQFWFNNLDHENRIRTSLITDVRSLVLSFVLQLEILEGDEWLPVIRYDTAHGEAHIDYLNLAGETYAKVWLSSRSPFNSAFTLAENELKANYHKHRARFLNQRDEKST